jgi:hypothetical protein
MFHKNADSYNKSRYLSAHVKQKNKCAGAIVKSRFELLLLQCF